MGGGGGEDGEGTGTSGWTWTEERTKRKGREDDRKWAILEQEVKGEGGVFWIFVLLFCFLFKKKKKRIKSESFFKKPKTPAGGGEREVRRATRGSPPRGLRMEGGGRGDGGEIDGRGQGGGEPGGGL